MSESFCPSCGAKIELVIKQAELALGPIEVRHFQKKSTKKLDEKSANLLQSNDNHHNDDDDDISDHHPLWPQFRRYCNTRNGWPTLKGFRKWLTAQRPVRVARKQSNARYDELLRISQERADQAIGQ